MCLDLGEEKLITKIIIKQLVCQMGICFVFSFLYTI